MIHIIREKTLKAIPVINEEFTASQFDWSSAVGRLKLSVYLPKSSSMYPDNLVEYSASVGYFGRFKLGRCVPVQLHNSVCPPETPQLGYTEICVYEIKHIL